MKEVDYIIVGLGLAGMAFCEQLESNNKSYVVFDYNDGDTASRVAGGLYNPVILKRYTLPWMAKEQLDLAIPYFKNLEDKLGVKAVYNLPVLKVFSSIEDQNNWFEASDKTGVSRFVNSDLHRKEYDNINAPFHYGEVKETGRIDIALLLNKYCDYLQKRGKYINKRFLHNALILNDNSIQYNDIVAKRIVFAEGFGIKENPFFRALPLVGNKGEYITIKAPKLKINAAIKSSFFIIPLGDDLYKVGATFNWKDKDTVPSKEAREELIQKLKKLISCEFQIVEHEAGVRPTTGDRRPLLGVHPKSPQLALLNGLGTRGIMMSPFLAKMLYEHLEEEKPLMSEVDINRFPQKFN